MDICNDSGILFQLNTAAGQSIFHFVHVFHMLKTWSHNSKKLRDFPDAQ